MALVRILSDDAEYSEKLTKDLRARGFDVEGPANSENDGDASPKISIMECTPEELPELASSIQQEMTATGPVSTDEIAFLIPQILPGNVHSLRAIVVRSKPQSETAPAEEPVSKMVQPSHEAENENADHTGHKPVPSPTVKSKPAGPKPADSEDFLVPHGLIWQAISEAETVSSQTPLASDAPDETLARTESIPEDSQPAILAMPACAETIALPRSALRPEFRSRSISASIKNRNGRRFWNIAALAAVAAVLALLIVSHGHRISPLPTPVEAHTSQPGETVPFHAEESGVPENGDNILAPTAAHTVTVKAASNRAHVTNKPDSGLGSDNSLGKDTVVRFGAARTMEANVPASNKQTRHAAGVRYFSDLD